MKKPKSKGERSFKKLTTEKDSLVDSSSFPIVGIGASAGGLEACTDFLRHLPTDTGMAFVLVQHLDPQHKSALTQILARETSMLVREAANSLVVKPNCVYVIPPNKNLIIKKRVIKLRPRPTIPGAHRPIDSFFQSLALDQKECAIGIVLSGTATDGTDGVEMIKSEGGITFAQDSTAKYDSMPRHAAASGCVDFVLSPREIAKELARIAKHPYLKGQALPLEIQAKREKRIGKGSIKSASETEESLGGPIENDGFKKVLLLLRNNSGVDFALYKSNTILRRTHRRMLLNKQRTMNDYAAFLKGNPKELEALYSDVLIGVTSFFRDPEAFEALKAKVFPKLLDQSRRDKGPVRVWTLGCSTGQEAYSIAMAYTEFCDTAPRAPEIQIFATDLNNPLLDKARHGLYPKTISGDMPEKRLKRFFGEEQGGYRVAKTLRELVIFARQNVLSDPPFSRLDLISCRNMLIYIEPELQKRILPTFHFTLKPGGFLFLGASESIGTFTDLFEPVDKKQKIFAKLPGLTPVYQLPVSKGYSAENKKTFAPAKGEPPRDFIGSEFIVQREADRILASRFAPPSVVINENLEVIQFRGAISPLLEPPSGKASFNVLKMASPSLMLPLRAVINEAKKRGKASSRRNVKLSKSGRPHAVDIEVTPIRNAKQICYLIVFEEVSEFRHSHGGSLSQQDSGSPAEATTTDRMQTKSPRRLLELAKELSEARAYADSLQEEHEVANEELQASNEEVQSANEELQSINEELETSKEELESTNEELTTVNEEMAHRNADLNRLNNDLNNFHDSINTAIVLLGRDLTIRRFTPLALTTFNLLPTDLGRPLNSVRHNLDIANLEELLGDVIKTVNAQEKEVRDKTGRWYLLRARPYLTLDNKIDGAVLMLTDVDYLKKTQNEIFLAKEYAEAIVAIVPPLLILDPNLRVISANESFYKHFRLSPTKTENQLVYELDKGQWNIPKLRKLLEEILPRNSFFKNFEVVHEFGDLGKRTLHLSAQRVDHVQKILLSIDDITELQQLEAEVRRSELRYRRLFEGAKDGVLLLDPKTRKITDANLGLAEFLGIAKAQTLGKELWEIGLLPDENATRPVFDLPKEESGQKVLLLNSRRGEREIELAINRYAEGGNEVIQCHVRDVSESRNAQRDLAEKARLLDLSNDAIIVRDTDDKISLWNKGAEKLFGWTCEEVIGKHLQTLLQTEFPKPMEQIVAQLNETGSFSGEVVQIARDGRRVPSLCRWVLDSETNSILTSYTDITERRQMQDELHTAHTKLTDRAGQLEKAVAVRTAELMTTNKQLEAFVYSIAHDLRAPLRSMQGFSAMLVEEAGTALSETARDYALRISSSAQFMDALLKDLIAYGGIAEEKVELSVVDLEHLVHLAATSVNGEGAAGKRAKLELTGPWPNVLAHEGTLGPVLDHLLENAIKFVAPEVTPKVRVRTEENDEFIRLWVEDNGIGVAADHHDQIFKLFTRLRGDKYGGTGVGLAVVKKGLERMSGRCGVESAPNKGSRFWIDLRKA